MERFKYRKMGQSTGQTIGIVALVLIAVVAVGFFATGGFEKLTGFAITPTPAGEVPETIEPVTGYVPHALTGGFGVFVFNAEDKDTPYGANDVYGKIWNPGTADWSGPFVVASASSDATTGKVAFSGDKIDTGRSYDIAVYQGDGGTNIYPETITVTIPQLSPEISSWNYPNSIYVSTEGSFSESACDSTTAAFDEGSDLITLNKTLSTVQGSLKWDCTYGQDTSGGVLKEPVVIFREKPGSELSDINDVEHIYMSTKTGGSGLSFPTGDLITEFLGGVPIKVGPSDGLFRSNNDAVLTITVNLPASEANVGTGSFEMIFDDLGDYRAKATVFSTTDFDVHAAAEITEFKIITT